MKNSIAKLSLMLMAFSLLFSGCDDEVVNSELILDIEKVANIEVALLAEMDRTSLGLEKVPNGTKVVFSINYSEFNPNASTGKWVQSTEVSNGIVSMEVPTNNNGVNVRIDFAPFVYDQVQQFGSPQNTSSQLYTADYIMVNTLPEQDYVRQVTYGSTDFGDNTPSISKTFKAQYINDILGEVKNVPQGTTIRMYTYSWTTTADVNSDGKFTATVPFEENINFEFQATFTNAVDNSENRKYSTSTAINTGNWDMPTIGLYFGEGSTWE